MLLIFSFPLFIYLFSILYSRRTCVRSPRAHRLDKSVTFRSRGGGSSCSAREWRVGPETTRKRAGNRPPVPSCSGTRPPTTSSTVYNRQRLRARRCTTTTTTAIHHRTVAAQVSARFRILHVLSCLRTGVIVYRQLQTNVGQKLMRFLVHIQ